MAIKVDFRNVRLRVPGGSGILPAPSAPYVKHTLPYIAEDLWVVRDMLKALVGVRIITGFQEHMHNIYIDARLPTQNF